MGVAIAQGVVTDPLVTNAPPTSGKISGPPGGVTPPPPVTPVGSLDYFRDRVSNSNPGITGAPARLDIFWRADGLKVWTARQNSIIRQFDVSPAWGINSGDWTPTGNTGAITDLRSVWWSPDGTVLSYARRISTSTRIVTFDQSATPWDLTVLGTAILGTTPSDLPSPDHVWSDDGLRVWVKMALGLTSTIKEFSCSVAWDPSTMNTTPVATFDMVPDAGTGTNTFCFSSDGTFMYVIKGLTLASWELTTPYDITSATNYAEGPSCVSNQTNIPRGLTFRADTGEILTGGDQGPSSQMRITTFSPNNAPNISAFAFNGEKDVSGGNVDSQEGLWADPTGERIYTCRGSIAVNDVFHFGMSSPNDISTLAFVDDNHADGQSPRGVALSENGDDLYIHWRNATNPDGVFRWPLSTAWDIDTKGSRTTLAGSDFNNAPQGLWFKPDGTELYLIDNSGKDVYQFTLPTPWSFTGATQTKSYNYTSDFSSMSDLTFTSDGLRMYAMNNTNDRVEQYNLTVAWDVSTAKFTGISLSLPGGSGGVEPRGVAVRGDYLYVCYLDNEFIEQFKLP